VPFLQRPMHEERFMMHHLAMYAEFGEGVGRAPVLHQPANQGDVDIHSICGHAGPGQREVSVVRLIEGTTASLRGREPATLTLTNPRPTHQLPDRPSRRAAARCYKSPLSGALCSGPRSDAFGLGEPEPFREEEASPCDAGRTAGCPRLCSLKGNVVCISANQHATAVLDTTR
jgi:hypothetical protein